jgi:purine-binding chemotaxis protein CheW
VDRIGDIVSVEPKDIEAPPETLKGAPRKFMRGVFPVQGKLYLLLDLDTLLADELCNRSASRASHSVLQ